jgi:hypothetical protein
LRRNDTERRIDSELLCRVHRPVWIVDELAADGDEVGFPVLKDGLGLIAVNDEIDRHGHDVHLATPEGTPSIADGELQ